MCQDQKSTPARALRNRDDLQTRLHRMLLSRNVDEGEILYLVSQVDKTHRAPVASVPRLSVASGYNILALMYTIPRPNRKTVDYAAKALRALGYVIDVGPATNPSITVKKWGAAPAKTISLWLALAIKYRETAPHLARHYEEYAKLTYRIVAGEDETFSDLLPVT
ncbi:uncharacterized protein BDV14DRAFT_199876 [Aspergillus stella-maris]|uniref:uncharacterized protein n=1 Tax=Aspergillus stella-maris TaxID=1810926 RepID=UPI003CCD1B94